MVISVLQRSGVTCLWPVNRYLGRAVLEKILQIRKTGNPPSVHGGTSSGRANVLLYLPSGQVKLGALWGRPTVCLRVATRCDITLQNLAAGYSAQCKVRASEPAHSFHSASSTRAASVCSFLFHMPFYLQSLTFVHVSRPGVLQVAQPATSIEKVIVKNIISNKWYTGNSTKMCLIHR